MGTRSLTTVIASKTSKSGIKKKEKIVTIYRQFDGYPSGHGVDLAEFLNSGKMVNGIPFGEEDIVFNGIECLAAQMVSYFKKGAGGIYLHRGGTKNCGEEYRYEVLDNGLENPLTLRCYDVYKKKWVFEGTPKEFLEKFEPTL